MSAPAHRGARLAGLSAIAFLIICGYSIARPAVESIFLADWGSKGLPAVWVGVVLAVALTVGLWGRLVRRLELAAVLGAASGIAGLLLVLLLGLHASGWRGASYLLYIWKDVYIVVLVETFYAFANVVFPLATARWAYGLFGALASIGGLAGSLLVGPLAERLGSGRATWFVLLDLALIGVLGAVLSKRAGVTAAEQGVVAKDTPGLVESLGVVRRSHYLLLLVGLIATVQLAINLVDYHYSAVLEVAYPETDARTAVIGRVYATIDGLSLLLHALTGPLLRTAGVAGTLLLIPLTLAAATVGTALSPGFASAVVLKVASKAFDYTWFRNAKEALYLPLSFDEKTRGKAVVDMLTYRAAKGGASAVVGGLLAAGAAAAVPLVLGGLVAVWLGLTAEITRRYRALTARAPTPPGR